MIYDLSPPIDDRLAVWPGDTPPTRAVLMAMERGDSVTLSSLQSTVHLGSHADGPNHYHLDGDCIGSQPLDHYLGRCQVIRLRGIHGERYGVDALPDGCQIDAPRVLLATGTYPDTSRFNQDFAAPSPSLIEFFAAQGVITLGVDTPSVDLFDSIDLPAHHACFEQGIRILETLQLADVPEGSYELIALPLKLMGFDGSPVRAILRTLD